MPPRRERAFSVIELMMSVGLMGVIVFALYGMFNHTQRALRANVTQVDVLEGGRAAMELVTRELSQVAASGATNCVNLLVGLAGSELSLSNAWYVRNYAYKPLRQALLTPNSMRTNHRYAVYYLRRENREYYPNAFWIYDATNGVGTLGYFHGTNVPAEYLGTNYPYGPIVTRLLPNPTNFSRVAEGVVHFRVVPYDATGRQIDWRRHTNYADTLYRRFGTNVWPYFYAQEDRWQGAFSPSTENRATFVGPGLPAYLEVELGMLEPKTLEEMRSVAVGNNSQDRAERFLSNHVGQVHLFRQRIAVREGGQLGLISDR
jgi:type II secretory pathway component PulJ